MGTGSAWQGTAEKDGIKQPPAFPHLDTNSKLCKGLSWALGSQTCLKAVPTTHLAVEEDRTSFPAQSSTGTSLADGRVRVQHCPALWLCAVDEPTQGTYPEKGSKVSLVFHHTGSTDITRPQLQIQYKGQNWNCLLPNVS